jgi:hypothetical protein
MVMVMVMVKVIVLVMADGRLCLNGSSLVIEDSRVNRKAVRVGS